MIDKKENFKGSLFALTVKAVVLNDAEEVLILRRSEKDSKSPERLDLPGGRVEGNEKLEDVLKREIKEELGIEIEVGPIIHHIDWTKKEKENDSSCWKGLRCLAFYRSGEIKISEEHKKFKWMNIDEAIAKLEDKGFEKDKRDALIKTKNYLEMKKSLDGWKRCLADFENYKKRQLEARNDFFQYALEGMILQILPVLDNFYASTAHIPEDQKNNSWVTGIMHIQKQMENILRENGVEEISVKQGSDFDPKLHESIPDKNKDIDYEYKNKIKEVILKGYKIKDKIIRPARVLVD